jgi:plastocyanin
MRLERLAWAIAIGLSVAFAGCGGGDGPAQPPEKKPEAPDKAEGEGSGGGDKVAEPEPEPSGTPVDPATAGSIKGTATFKGEPPKPGVHNISGDPKCAAMHSKPLRKEDAVIKDGRIQNVFVYVKSGLEGAKFEVPSAPAVLDQEGCQYKPHVLGVMKGQALEIRNSDDLLHNVNGNAFKKNKGFNFGQDGKGKVNTVKFLLPEFGVPVKCDVHSWMASYIHVVAHPKFAVSGADGSFEIPGLPPGEYEVVAWHESFGEQSKKVTVGEGAEAAVEFEFEKK